jgi:hypothetical protein
VVKLQGGAGTVCTRPTPYTTTPAKEIVMPSKPTMAAKTYVAEVNARTVCAHCGAQPIEWHNPDHVALNRQKFRINTMVTCGASTERIQAEMDACTPLCRRCHMKEDGRLRLFVEARGSRLEKGTQLPSKPCAECHRLAKPLRRGLCAACDQRRRRLARAAS